MYTDVRRLIEDAWIDRTLLESKEHITAIESVIDNLDKGNLRVAELITGRWHINDWIKKAVILYFPIREMAEIKVDRKSVV